MPQLREAPINDNRRNCDLQPPVTYAVTDAAGLALQHHGKFDPAGFERRDGLFEFAEFFAQRPETDEVGLVVSGNLLVLEHDPVLKLDHLTVDRRELLLCVA